MHEVLIALNIHLQQDDILLDDLIHSLSHRIHEFIVALIVNRSATAINSEACIVSPRSGSDSGHSQHPVEVCSTALH